MSGRRILALTLLAMVAFAGNSLLARLALRHTAIDPASFTSIRLVSGALVLWLIARSRSGPRAPAGSWASALALFAYAATFSYAYVSLSAGTGALLLFAAVQATMIGHGHWAGDRLHARQTVGLAVALTGLLALLWPGLAAPPLGGSLLMVAAGVAWGVYSLRGRGTQDPLRATAGNFQRSVVLTIVLSLAMLPSASVDAAGAACAVAAAALASALGYAIWYAALPGLGTTRAATVQLSVPVIAALAGVLLLSEPLTPRLVVAAATILGGIALVVVPRRRSS